MAAGATVIGHQAEMRNMGKAIEINLHIAGLKTPPMYFISRVIALVLV